ncbi:MAG: M23 family metallopeptidase [Spirochaetia bacterium]|jgi:murein DD-endopeptidase MepM/ murein hydrolase activator NlpD
MSRLPERAAFSALLFLLLLRPLWAGTVLLNDPYLMLCVTDPDARYTVVDGALQASQGLFSFFPPWGRPLEPRIKVPSQGRPGDLLQCFVSSDEPLGSVTVTLQEPGKKELSRAVGFRASSEGARETWAALIGVPAGAAVHAYSLGLRIGAGPRSCLLLKPFNLQQRAFFSERIGLTKDLTALYTVPDPRKIAEYRVLSRLLSTAHPDAVYETGPLLVPFPAARRTSGYGDRREYLLADAGRELSIHEGIDLAEPTDTPVPSCGRGRVVFASNRILTGNTIIIEHLPGLFSIYYHMSTLLVAEGEEVQKSQIIGKVGMTGFATGPHLHWEIQSMGTAVDPDELTQGPLLDINAAFHDIEARNSTEGR